MRGRTMKRQLSHIPSAAAPKLTACRPHGTKPFAVLFRLPRCSSRTSTTTCVSAMTLLCQSNKSARRYHRQTIPGGAARQSAKTTLALLRYPLHHAGRTKAAHRRGFPATPCSARRSMAHPTASLQAVECQSSRAAPQRQNTDAPSKSPRRSQPGTRPSALTRTPAACAASPGTPPAMRTGVGTSAPQAAWAAINAGRFLLGL